MRVPARERSNVGPRARMSRERRPAWLLARPDLVRTERDGEHHAVGVAPQSEPVLVDGCDREPARPVALVAGQDLDLGPGPERKGLTGIQGGHDLPPSARFAVPPMSGRATD